MQIAAERVARRLLNAVQPIGFRLPFALVEALGAERLMPGLPARLGNFV